LKIIKSRASERVCKLLIESGPNRVPNSLSFIEINSLLLRLRKLGYSGKLGPSDLSRGTFMLTIINAVGVIFAHEIVVEALGGMRKLPCFSSNDCIEERFIIQTTRSDADDHEWILQSAQTIPREPESSLVELT